MKAIFQGEFHVSSADRDLLHSRIDNEVDAIFIEQREDRVSPDSWSLGYLFFLVGALIIYWFQALVDSGSDIEQKTDKPIFKEIDTPLPELYARFPDMWVYGSAALSVVFLLYGIYVPRISIPIFSEPPVVSTVYTVLLKPLIVLGAPVVFSFLLILFEQRQMGSRDEDMAESITEISEDNDFQTVVVSCGELHLERLSDLLKERGWEVEINESNHSRLAKMWGS